LKDMTRTQRLGLLKRKRAVSKPPAKNSLPYYLLLLLTLGVRLLAVLARGLGMLLGACRVFFALRVIALAMMFSGAAVGFGGVLVMFGCFIVFVFGH
jgi:hypothetical protein